MDGGEGLSALRYRQADGLWPKVTGEAAESGAGYRDLAAAVAQDAAVGYRVQGQSSGQGYRLFF